MTVSDAEIDAAFNRIAASVVSNPKQVEIDYWRDEIRAMLEAAAAVRPSFDMKNPPHIDSAPRDATWLLLRVPKEYGYPNYRWVVGHWADGGGDEQPRFRGWFFNDGYSMRQIIPDPTHWLPFGAAAAVRRADSEIAALHAQLAGTVTMLRRIRSDVGIPMAHFDRASLMDEIDAAIATAESAAAVCQKSSVDRSIADFPGIDATIEAQAAEIDRLRAEVQRLKVWLDERDMKASQADGLRAQLAGAVEALRLAKKFITSAGEMTVREVTDVLPKIDAAIAAAEKPAPSAIRRTIAEIGKEKADDAESAAAEKRR
jgi:hypothetical protein